MKTRFPRPLILDSVSSTNDYLKSYVEEGLPRVVMARQQTRGRGRHGKTWFSKRDQGLYVSYLCFPRILASQAVRLNRVAALAVALTLEEFCPSTTQVQIKEPNDVLLSQKKIAGILLETASLSERLSWAILGIGINLTQEEFPFEAKPAPTSLTLEGVPTLPDPEIYAILTRNLTQLLKESEGGFWKRIEEEFQRRVWSPE